MSMCMCMCTCVCACVMCQCMFDACILLNSSAAKYVLWLQYWLVAQRWYGLLSIFVPVFMGLLLPFRMHLHGDTNGFLRACSTLQWVGTYALCGDYFIPLAVCWLCL